MTIKDETSGASGVPDECCAWISQVDSAKDMSELQDSGRFPSLDAKLSAGLSKVLAGDIGRQVRVAKEALGVKGMLMKGRHVLWLVYQHYKITAEEGAVLDIQDLLAVSLAGSDIARFMSDWDETLSGMRNVPEDGIL